MAKTCGCGCGAEVRPGNRFVKGHNRRVQGFSEEHRRRLAEAALRAWARRRARRTLEGLLRARRVVEFRLCGLSLAQIAREVGWSKSRAARLLRACGCPPPPPDEVRELQGAASAARNRELCARLGWPEVVVPGQARILAALWRGPKTARQLADALGLSDRRTLRRRLLAPLLRAHAVEGAAKGAVCSYVVRLGGWPPRYALSDWLRERKADEAR